MRYSCVGIRNQRDLHLHAFSIAHFSTTVRESSLYSHMTRPQTLYKYCAFNVNSLRHLSKGEIYYAAPKSFNDPLDCNPTLFIDTERTCLEELFLNMLGAAEGPQKAQHLLEDCRYQSTQHGCFKTDADVERYYMESLALELKRLLACGLGMKGVFSLAREWNCPLMWSHYADQHRGICIEYDVADSAFSNINPVDYNRPRSIKVSDLISWKLNGCSKAKSDVYNTWLLTKAPQWGYEQEWRDVVDASGTKPAPARISGVYFGLRCDAAVQTVVVKSFSNPQTNVSFYQIVPHEVSFALMRSNVDTAYVLACGLQQSAVMLFRDVITARRS